jgi:hypothetical protein
MVIGLGCGDWQNERPAVTNVNPGFDHACHEAAYRVARRHAPTATVIDVPGEFIHDTGVRMGQIQTPLSTPLIKLEDF